MAYNAKQLARQGGAGYASGNVKSIWAYASADTLETILASGYFNNATRRLNQGDIIDVIAGVGGTLQAGRIQVTSAKAAATVTTARASLQAAKYVTAALESATIPAASVAGANVVAYVNTGTTPGNLQLPTAADIVAAMPGAAVGQSYVLHVRNGSGSANTATLTTNTGLTLTGTMTIAQNATRTLMVTLTSLTAVDVRSIGLSAAAA